MVSDMIRRELCHLVERFGSNITALREESEKVAVKIKCIPSEMKEWVLAHLNQCEVIAPKNFRDWLLLMGVTR